MPYTSCSRLWCWDSAWAILLLETLGGLPSQHKLKCLICH